MIQKMRGALFHKVWVEKQADVDSTYPRTPTTSENQSCRKERRFFVDTRDCAHENQRLQGRDDDRNRPWGHLEPLLHAQRTRRGRRSRPGSGPTRLEWINCQSLLSTKRGYPLSL